MCAKEAGNAVLDQAEDTTGIRISKSFLENRVGGWHLCSTPVGTSSILLQASQGLANDRSDNLIFVGWGAESDHAWFVFSEEKTRKGALTSVYDHIKEVIDPYTLIAEHSLDRSDDIPELKSIERFESVSRETVNHIKGFASLGDNWDSYGAEAIKWSTIIKAIDFFSILVSKLPNAPVPFVAPACDGEIHFEWEMCAKALKHTIPEGENDPFEYLLIDKTSGRVERTYDRALNMDKMLDIAVRWMR